MSSLHLNIVGAFLTFMLGVCLLGNWSPKPPEQQAEMPEVAPRPRRHGRVRSVSPRRIARRHPRTHSASPGPHKYHHSRLPKNVTYALIIAVLSFVTHTWAAALGDSNTFGESAIVPTVTTKRAPSSTSTPDELSDTTTIDLIPPMSNGSLPPTKDNGFPPPYNNLLINLTIYTSFDDCSQGGLSPRIRTDTIYGEALSSGDFGPFQAIRSSRPLLGHEMLQVGTFPPGTDAASGRENPCIQEMNKRTSYLNPDVDSQLNSVQFGGPKAWCAVFNGLAGDQQSARHE